MHVKEINIKNYNYYFVNLIKAKKKKNRHRKYLNR